HALRVPLRALRAPGGACGAGAAAGRRREPGRGGKDVSGGCREVVSVEELVKDFRPGFGLRRKRVLHGISFRVLENEIFGFVGPNGAGKTTALKVLMGLIHPTAGRARILGHDIAETEFRRHVGFLPENPYFYDHLTAREILRFYGRLSGLAGASL